MIGLSFINSDRAKMPQTDFETAVQRLQALPDEPEAGIGSKINRYLNKLDDLRRAIQTGLDNGAPKPADDVFARLDAKYRGVVDETGPSCVAPFIRELRKKGS
jgi:hypothetical protein